jgi:hypothetical protein
VVRLVVRGDEPSGCQEVVAGKIVVRCNVGACGRGVGGRSATDPVRKPFCRRCCTEGFVTSCRGARGSSPFRPRSVRTLAGTAVASRCGRARSARQRKHWGVSDGLSGDRPRPNRSPRVELGAVGDAHQVAVPVAWKFRLPNRISNPARRGRSCPWSISALYTRCGSPSWWLLENSS